MPMIIINGELTEEFSYDEAGLMQALQSYAAAKAQGAEVDLVVDVTKAGPEISGIMEQIAPFMVPYQGSQEMLEVNVEELAGAASGQAEQTPAPPPGMGPGGPPPGMGPGGPPPGMGPGGPPPGMGPGGPPPGMGPGTGGDPMQGAGGPPLPEVALSEEMVQQASRKIIKPQGKGRMPV